MSDRTFDYIVIGAGSAGCTIATHFVERRKGTVLLLEAGGRDKDMFIHIPGRLVKAIPRYTWPYAAEPSDAVKGCSIAVPQLRVHGIAGLRVADNSTMPCIPSGNTNAPTIALAEMASDLILGAA